MTVENISVFVADRATLRNSYAMEIQRREENVLEMSKVFERCVTQCDIKFQESMPLAELLRIRAIISRGLPDHLVALVGEKRISIRFHEGRETWALDRVRSDLKSLSIGHFDTSVINCLRESFLKD